MNSLSGQQKKQFQQSLLSAFPTRMALKRMVEFGLNKNLDVIAGGENLEDITFNLILWAFSRGEIERLIKAAVNDNPGNAELRRFEETIGIAAPSGDFESIVLKNVNFIDIEVWRAKLRNIEKSICRIDLGLGNPAGTAFKVAQDKVLTNYHVLKDVIEQRADSQSVLCKFGYKKLINGEVISGHELKLSSEWLIDSSKSDELDYALVRLADSANDDSFIKMHEIDNNDAKDGYPIFIFQHPQAEPLKLTVGSIIGKRGDNLIYTANTLPGSSGSPCFLSDLQFLGLHNYGDPVKGNRGIFVNSFIERIQRFF